MRALLASLCLVFLGSAAQALECPPCGPLFCTNDPAYAAELARKKQGMPDTPERHRALMDRVGACVGCLRTAPDGVSIVTERSVGSLERSWQWSSKDEDNARKRLEAGALASSRCGPAASSRSRSRSRSRSSGPTGTPSWA